MIHTIHQNLIEISKKNKWVRLWRNGMIEMIDPRILMIQKAFYIAQYEDHHLDEEMAAFMLQIAYENTWYFAGDLKNLFDELDNLSETFHINFKEMSASLNNAREIILNFKDINVAPIQKTKEFYLKHKNQLEGDNEIIDKAYTDNFSKVYRVIDLLKPLAAALLVHKYLTQHDEGSYNYKYDILASKLSKTGYKFGENDKILSFIKDNSTKATLLIQSLSDYLFNK